MNVKVCSAPLVVDGLEESSVGAYGSARFHTVVSCQPVPAPALSTIQTYMFLLVLANDLKFCDWLGLDSADYIEFKETAIPRLKFSSQFDTWVKTGRPIQV